MRRPLYIMIIFISTIFMITVLAQAGEQLIFEDDFISNANNWKEANNNQRMLKIRNGKYVFEHKRQEKSWYVWKTIPIDQDLDFQIQVTIQKVNGIDNHGYGIVWGMEDTDNFYRFITGE